MDTDGFRKAIHFDLDTATVEATFGKKNTSMAYRKIRKFLESNGFAHSQYSGYMSLRPMSDLEVYRTYDMMKEALPWLEHVRRRFTSSWWLMNSTFSAFHTRRMRISKAPRGKLAQFGESF